MRVNNADHRGSRGPRGGRGGGSGGPGYSNANFNRGGGSGNYGDRKDFGGRPSKYLLI